SEVVVSADSWAVAQSDSSWPVLVQTVVRHRVSWLIPSHLKEARVAAARALCRRMPRGGDRMLHWMRVSSAPVQFKRRTRLPFGSTIEVDLNERIERQMYYFGWYQRHQSQFLRANLRKGDVFVDVGAHIGLYT